MDLKKEQIIKSKLGLILKLLLIALAIFKLAEYIIEDKAEPLLNSNENNIQTAIIDSVEVSEGGIEAMDDADEPLAKEKEENSPIPNTASIYIFDDNGLDIQTSRLVGDLFFKDYSLKGKPKGFSKEELLLGNLNSSANTELICIGTISYSYFANSHGGTSCTISLYFDAYNKTTGERMKKRSKSINKTGVATGNNKNGAKQNALQRLGL